MGLEGEGIGFHSLAPGLFHSNVRERDADRLCTLITPTNDQGSVAEAPPPYTHTHSITAPDRHRGPRVIAK